MCGITGWIDWDRDLTCHGAILEGMIESIAHRGPDARGHWLSRHAALGHRRLTIIDPEGGAQPMSRRLGARIFTIVYNGELYNTAEVRQELEAAGHIPDSRCDTEIVLLAYMAWGPACLERFNGIFAFGIWDEAEQRLFLARDRLGVKPLFYARRENGLLFGSELKSLLAHPSVAPEVDEEGLHEIFGLGPSRTPGHGIFRGVHELRPGWCATFDPSGLKQWRYWSLVSRPHTDDLETTTETVRDLVVDAVRRQLVSDVPIAALLSGGLDSSAISAIAAAHFRERQLGQLRTWSIDYQDNDRYFQTSAFQPNLDAPWVKRMSDFLGSAHYDVIIDTPELVAALTAAMQARDLPGMADVDASLLLFCKAIRQRETVVLSGECADEIFGGYPWFHSPEALEGKSFPWIRMLDQRTALISPELRARLKPAEYVAERYRQTIAEVPMLQGEAPLEARRREMFYLNLNWFMATLLDRKDRMSMAVGLEARVPFCDHRIVEYVWNIPWEMKMADGREKGILRRAMRGILPDDVLYRKKSPYPKTHNPAYFNAVRDALLAVLDDPAAPLHQVVDAAAVRELACRDDSAAAMPWFGQLMGLPSLFAYLGQLDTWMRTYRVTFC